MSEDIGGKTNAMGLHIIVVGDVVNGLSFIGPFKTGDDAITWALDHISDNWSVAPLEAQDQHQR